MQTAVYSHPGYQPKRQQRWGRGDVLGDPQEGTPEADGPESGGPENQEGGTCTDNVWCQAGGSGSDTPQSEHVLWLLDRSALLASWTRSRQAATDHPWQSWGEEAYRAYPESLGMQSLYSEGLQKKNTNPTQTAHRTGPGGVG